jgi:peptidoglycan/xylan/chitin deacetylase (PgdA/CDA1 family)
LPKNSVMLTFDDGYETFYTMAYPILQKYGLNGVCYVITDKINVYGYLNDAQIAEMQSSGLVELGGHTNKLHEGVCPEYKNLGYMQCSEPNVVNYDLNMARKKIGSDAMSFAYPYNGYEGYAVEAVQKNGFSYAFTENPGYVTQSSDDYELPRFVIGDDTSMAEFEKILINGGTENGK